MGGAAAATMEMYDTASNAEILISQNTQTIGGETVFTRDGIWEEEKTYCIVKENGVDQIRSPFDCDFEEFEMALDGTNQVQILKEKTLWEELTQGFSFDDTSKKVL